MDISRGEVNFLTEMKMYRKEILDAIRNEFDFISFCQALIIPYGIEAKKKLDRFIALSMRKLLFDKNNSLILNVCPEFKMPPLTGHPFYVAGEHDEMQLHTIWTNIHVKKQSEWISFTDWKNQKIAWIDKTEKDVPILISDTFYMNLLSVSRSKAEFTGCYEQVSEVQDGKNNIAWKLKDPDTNQKKIFDILKQSGYYDLTIQRMIKHIADKTAAHTDSSHNVWIGIVNTSIDYRHSAISVFATQMIYAATKQIDELKDYLQVEPMLETL